MPYVKTTATKKVMAMEARIRAIPGGTSASKTISVLLYLIALAQTDFEPTLTSIVSESFPHLRRGALRDFLLIMKTQGYYRDDAWQVGNSVYTFETGSKIEFFSVDEPDKMRGARRDRLFINEANNIPFSAFEELEVRTKQFIILDWNPTNEFWYYTEVKPKRKDFEEITLTYKDNEALDPQIIASIEARRNRKDWWPVYGEGKLGVIEGRIYSGWSTIDSVPPDARLEGYGIDFGYTNDPTAAVAIWKFNDAYILDEILFQKGLSGKQIAETFLNNPKATVWADSADPRLIDEIHGYGVHILGAAKGKDSIKHGIQVVQDQNIMVTSRSRNTYDEYKNYLWAQNKWGKIDGDSKPESGWDHAMDALRYGITSIVSFGTISESDRRHTDSVRRDRAGITADAGLV